MRLRNEAKVGLIVFAGAVALVVVYWFLGGLGMRASTYPIYAVFGNAGKLDKGAMVRLAGVQIGVVTQTRLVPGAKARVDMVIYKENDIPADSIARATTGAFIGEYFVDISAGKSKKMLERGQEICTEETVPPDELMQDAAEILTELKRSTKGINDLLGDPKMTRDIRQMVASLNEAAKSASKLTEAAYRIVDQATPQVNSIMAEAQKAALAAGRISCELEDMLKEDVRPNMKTVLKKANNLMTHVDESVAQAKELMAVYKGGGVTFSRTLEQAEKTVKTVDEVAVQAKQMMTNLNEASCGIKGIATDPEIKADLKTTLRNAAQASGQAKELVNTLNQKFGPKPSPSPALRSAVPDYGIAVNALANTGDRQSRVDAYYTFLGQRNEFYRVGAYSIGENTGVIAQGGLVLSRANSFRYGVYDSQVGVGFDQHVGQSGLLSFDWFRPNYGQFEARGTVNIGDAFGLYVGVNDLIHQQNRDLMVGLRYRK